MTRARATEAMILAGDVLYAGSDRGVMAADAETGSDDKSGQCEPRRLSEFGDSHR